MTPAEAADELLAIFQRHGLTFASVEDARQRSTFVSPLLGYLLARLPDPVAFDHVLAFLRAVQAELAGSAEPPTVLAGVRDGTRAERNRAATRISDLRDQAVLAGAPVDAAFADAASHVAECWADPTNEVGGNEPFPRAKAAVTALATALALARGLDERDKAQRADAHRRLLEILRAAVPRLD